MKKSRLPTGLLFLLGTNKLDKETEPFECCRSLDSTNSVEFPPKLKLCYVVHTEASTKHPSRHSIRRAKRRRPDKSEKSP